MSNYNDFVKDFPSRCKEVLLDAEGLAAARGREVTLSLMTAAAALIVPFERLNPEAKNEHPARDKQRYPELARQLNELLNQSFLGSPLWDDEAASWRAGKLKSIEGTHDGWPELKSPKPVTSEKQVKSILKVMRNALAHGNIFTKRRPTIEELIFISRRENEKGILIGYNYIQFASGLSPFSDLLVRVLGGR